jgi:hypothetical protein
MVNDAKSDQFIGQILSDLGSAASFALTPVFLFCDFRTVALRIGIAAFGYRASGPTTRLNGQVHRSVAMLRKALTLTFAGTLALTGSAANSVMASDTPVEDILLVWSGDQARKAPAFVAVIDFDRHSPRNGKVLRTVTVAATGALASRAAPSRCLA